MEHLLVQDFINAFGLNKHHSQLLFILESDEFGSHKILIPVA